MTTLLRKMWKNHSKHKKLCEEWALAECDGSEGWWGGAAGCGTGEARYAGSAAVERAASAPATARAVASALHIAKESNRKMKRVNLSISPTGIVATDAETSENVLNLSIYRISFCSADGASARVFAVVEGSGGAGGAGGANDTHTAHVFVCSRRKHARSFALALAHAFNDAYLAWQSRQDARATSSPASLRIEQHRPAEPWVHCPIFPLIGPAIVALVSSTGCPTIDTRTYVGALSTMPAEPVTFTLRLKDDPNYWDYLGRMIIVTHPADVVPQWVSFAGDSDSDSDEGGSWRQPAQAPAAAPAPLVTFD